MHMVDVIRLSLNLRLHNLWWRRRIRATSTIHFHDLSLDTVPSLDQHLPALLGDSGETQNRCSNRKISVLFWNMFVGLETPCFSGSAFYLSVQFRCIMQTIPTPLRSTN